MAKRIPLVGIGIMIFRKNKILLGKRKGSHGQGDYAFPGGHLDYMENFEECAIREIKEETGIKVKNIKFQLLSNIKKFNPKHYVHIGLIADHKNGEPKILEPDKCEGWDWYKLDTLPKPLFWPTQIAIDCYKNKKIYLDNQ